MHSFPIHPNAGLKRRHWRHTPFKGSVGTEEDIQRNIFLFNINRFFPLGATQNLIEPPHVQVKIKSYWVASMGLNLVSVALKVS